MDRVDGDSEAVDVRQPGNREAVEPGTDEVVKSGSGDAVERGNGEVSEPGNGKVWEPRKGVEVRMGEACEPCKDESVEPCKCEEVDPVKGDRKSRSYWLLVLVFLSSETLSISEPPEVFNEKSAGGITHEFARVPFATGDAGATELRRCITGTVLKCRTGIGVRTNDFDGDVAESKDDLQDDEEFLVEFESLGVGLTSFDTCSIGITITSLSVGELSLVGRFREFSLFCIVLRFTLRAVIVGAALAKSKVFRLDVGVGVGNASTQPGEIPVFAALFGKRNCGPLGLCAEELQYEFIPLLRRVTVEP